MYSYRIRCKYCQKQHISSQKCRIACIYCHQYHPRAQMVHNICPNMMPFVQQFRVKQQFQCQACLGEGTLQKEIQSVYYEIMSKYQKRLKEWNQQNQNMDQISKSNKAIPQRKVIRVEKTKEQHKCKDCEGSGKIQKVINCCLEGCRECNYQSCYLNPIWSKYHCQKLAKTCNKKRRCSVCSYTIQFNQQYHKLDCGHPYHINCYQGDDYLGGAYCVNCEQILDGIQYSFEDIKLEVGVPNKENAVGYSFSLAEKKEYNYSLKSQSIIKEYPIIQYQTQNNESLEIQLPNVNKEDIEGNLSFNQNHHKVIPQSQKQKQKEDSQDEDSDLSSELNSNSNQQLSKSSQNQEKLQECSTQHNS